MSFYLRKSLSVGLLRFNLSKSGIGVSAGLRGLRFGLAGPRGHYVHAGRHGLYFRQSLNAPGGAAAPAVTAPATATVGPMVEIESGSVKDMVPESANELLKDLNERRAKVRHTPIVVIVGSLGLATVLFGAGSIPLAFAYAVAFAGAVWLTRTGDAQRRTGVVFYELEPATEQAYQRLHDAFAQVAACKGTWHISARGAVRAKKYHAGAGAVIDRKRIVLGTGDPPDVKTNIAVPLLPVGRQTLAFMPDRVLVFDSGGVGAIEYGDLRLEIADSRFIEEGAVPSDTTVVDKTWRYVNKKGSPDRRFKDNRELPICAYEMLVFSSSSGLQEAVQLSKRGVGEELEVALRSVAGKARG